MTGHRRSHSFAPSSFFLIFVFTLFFTLVTFPSNTAGFDALTPTGQVQPVIAATAWTAFEGFWLSRGIGGGGTFFSASISPHDPDEIYIASDMRGVYHSTDFGGNWRMLDFHELQGGINSHIRFTSDPSILYAVSIVSDPMDLRLPVKSTDGGASWSMLESDPTWGETFTLHADPSSTRRLLISSWTNLFFSDDGGSSFDSVYATSDANYGLAVAGVFWGADDIFVATMEGLLLSTDGGSSFSLYDQYTGVPADEAPATFTGAREGATTRFFVVTLDRNSVWSGITGEEMWSYQGVYRFDLGDTGWVSTTNGLPVQAHPFFVSMASNDVSTVYLAGGDIWEGFPIVYKTTDGGASWFDVFLTASNENIATGWCGDGGDVDWWYPEYAMSFAVSPIDPDRVVIGDLGFFHVTSDGGELWRQAYVDSSAENPPGQETPRGKQYPGNGLENTSSWWLHWQGDSRVIAGFSDISGIMSDDGGDSWIAGSSFGFTENSTYCIVEAESSGTLYAATSSVHDMYESTRLTDDILDAGDGAVIYSTDGGDSWRTLRDAGNPVVWLAFDPNDSETMYASVVNSSTGGIYVTHDLSSGPSASWIKLSEPPRTEGHPYNIHVLDDGMLVATFSGRIDAGGSFTQSSGVFVSTDEGASWEDRSDQKMRRWTKDVTIDPHEPGQNTWYVSVFSHWGSPPNEVGGLYRTTDRGLGWTRISDLYRVESASVHPENPDLLYLTTETQGLWKTTNLTEAAPVFTQVAGFPFVHPVRVFFGGPTGARTWVTTFGGGLWVKMFRPLAGIRD